MKTVYSEYMSDKQVTVAKKVLFTDCDGFPNENAFRDFIGHLTEDDDCYLACVNVDLSESNKNSFAFGTLMLRKTFLRLKERFFVFRVHGDKFNIIVPKADIELAEKMLSSEGDGQVKTFYGFIKDMPITSKNCSELRKHGVELMYQDKALRTNQQAMDVREDKIVGNKGNTPSELQETVTHKFIETMWYDKIVFKEHEPDVRDITVWVFPTEYKENLASVNMIVVVDDLINTRVYSGTSVTFGFDGIRFAISGRFDSNGQFNVVSFRVDNGEGKCELKITAHEGECIPASFGKRIGNGQEIYPFKANPFGTYSYIFWDNETQTATLDDTGMVKMDDKLYSVHFNSQGIDLIEQ